MVISKKKKSFKTTRMIWGKRERRHGVLVEAIIVWIETVPMTMLPIV